ncbi:hypothetical protein [Arthrobacter sp. ISL-69]|nr:hypothetical protein [Arthrobacter sp. ISL-69]MBT2538976.1 hypothetical protein [Arthrobacter sp. ISL-69]
MFQPATIPRPNIWSLSLARRWVGLEGEFQELVGFAAAAFPPVDEGDRSD